MIGISKLYLGLIEPSDPLRYARKSAELPSHLLQFSSDKRPVVVWNCTSRCNLSCRHCYANCGQGRPPEPELTTAEAKTMIDDLAAFHVPVLLFSGGEPLMRKDLYELIRYTVEKGIRAVISTNGTLITPEVAKELKALKLSYVGISLDGLEEAHNALRRSPDAFARAMAAIKACREAGIKVGIRMTLQQLNAAELPAIFNLLKTHNIPRACFYHWVTCGSGTQSGELELNHEQTRKAVDQIITLTAELHRAGYPAEILTVDNHCDAAYLYMRMKRENNTNADDVMTLLRMNGGNNSGHGIGCISWNGDVFPDQFWRTRCVGNVLKTPFSQIWSDPEHPFLAPLRDKKNRLCTRCKTCRFLDVCAGNLRARADRGGDDIWREDPACYLTDDEIRPDKI